MKQLFDDVSVLCSRITTKKYSTSFSLGIRFLGKELRDPIYSVYGFVRFADEIVDSFHAHNKAELLEEFRADTWKAIERKISLNPILNSFQCVVHQYGIGNDLIELFLDSMAADLSVNVHTASSYRQYILGSAEAVGLMCLRVFTAGDDKLYNTLQPSAMRLGAAFQKVNFLRDIQADYQVLGRTYFPGIDFDRFSAPDKQLIQNDIEADFKAALPGIRRLPPHSRKGVYLAYFYYRKLFQHIKKTPVENVLTARIRIPNYRKITLLFHSMIRLRFNLL